VEEAFRVDAAENLERAVCRCTSVTCSAALVKGFEQDVSHLHEDARAEVAAAGARMKACHQKLVDAQREASLASGEDAAPTQH
jgi:predicted component of type VI protein secretion system